MSLDMIAQFESKIREAKRQDRATHFLVAVEKVARSRDPLKADHFMVVGRRMDNDQPIVLTSKKSTAGQHLPAVGAVMRADKAKRLPADAQGRAAYDAEYFHAYGKDDLCIHGVVRASKPFKRGELVSASVQVVNLESGGGFITKPAQLDAALLKALKPWEAEQSVLNHDVNGKPIWGTNGALGVQPFVMLRIVGGETPVPFYGLGAVDQRQSAEDAPNPRLPTDEEILAQVRKNPQYQRIVDTLNIPEFANYGFALIPGIQFNVGRSSLSGGKENYLGVPAAWDWEHRNQQAGESSTPNKTRGWRGGYIHVKKTEAERHIVVDAAPSISQRLSPDLPKSKLELEILSQRAGQSAGQSQQQGTAPRAQQPAAAPQAPAARAPRQPQPEPAPASAPAPAPEQKAAAARSPRQSQPAAEPAPAPAPHVAEQPPVDAYADEDFDVGLDEFAEDLAAMEAFAAEDENDMDAETDDLLAEAAARAELRHSGPRM